MFKKIKQTAYPPKEKPVMAWDGTCGFCHYWVIKWRKLTGERIIFKPFQQVYQQVPDIDLKYFRQAIRFLDTDGRVYTGPEAVFQALHQYGNKWRWVMPLYKNIWLFRFLSDLFYAFVSANRTWIYRVTIHLFGKNPARPRYYWVIYLAGLSIFLAAALTLAG